MVGRGNRGATALQMASIKLNREWQLGIAFARGGFGRVHEAKGEDGTVAVLKLIPKAPGADRELLFGSLPNHPNIIPIIDSGEWNDFYALVMPRAEKSLRQHLHDSGGSLELTKVIAVLTDIAEALASLEAGVVHRDLKPENVLLYEGRWYLADFGIARYADATTAPDTHKFSMTPAYAAPEQWRGEHATNATDIYAFGVVAFELTQGTLPFTGPRFREQHLDSPPPSLTGCPPSFASLVTECLYKAAAARPTAANILARLRDSDRPLSEAAAKLQEAQRIVAERTAAEVARQSAAQTRDENRRQLYEAATESLKQVIGELHRQAVELAPATEVSESEQSLVLTLGHGKLVIDHVQPAPPECLKGEGLEPPFDVIGYSAIGAQKPSDRFGYQGRAHSLWFCDAYDEGVYRWYELAFMMMPTTGQQFKFVPAALAPSAANARRALSAAIDIVQMAWEPVPFDQGQEGQFIDRWLGWFAAASDGSLSQPRHMPEASGGRHRRPLMMSR